MSPHSDAPLGGPVGCDRAFLAHTANADLGFAPGRPAGPTSRGHQGVPPSPDLLTADEAARLLRTSRKAIYAMVERGQLPGVTRIGRRVLFRRDDLVHWLDQKRAPSL